MTTNIQDRSEKPPLIVIAGATATGKSAAALEVARERNGIVINADASQLYGDLRILSARPTEAEMEGIPHRLYGTVDGAVAMSAADWAEVAMTEIEQAWSARQVPILVGGTGMYLNVLLQGIAPVPDIGPHVREVVRAMTTEQLAVALAAEDPAMAARLRPSDTQRQARALEVVRSTGRSLAEWQTERVGGIGGKVALDFRVIDLPRDALYASCDLRFDRMLDGGALGEVETLATRCLDPALPVMKAIGVPPLLDHLKGELSLEEATEIAKRDTRRYAKRQQTWFRTQRPDL